MGLKSFIVLFLAISLLSACGEPQPGPSDLQFVQGKMFMKGEDKPFSGQAIDHHDNGKKRSQCQFVNGLHDGLCIEWYENGQIKSWKEGHKGKLFGYSKYWQENGDLISCSYIDESQAIHRDCEEDSNNR